MDKQNNLIWIDLEMTGLSVEHENIIEIATIITDSDLNILAEGPDLVIHQADTLLDKMEEWNTKQHGKTGLTEAVRNSRITVAEAERKTLDFISEYVDPNCSPMCGNSICTDRRFLARYMPKLEAFFHYRHIDVSTLKELAKRWASDIPQIEKESDHRALNDIKDSINELKHYRKYFIQQQGQRGAS